VLPRTVAPCGGLELQLEAASAANADNVITTAHLKQDRGFDTAMPFFGRQTPPKLALRETAQRGNASPRAIDHFRVRVACLRNEFHALPINPVLLAVRRAPCAHLARAIGRE
jgi:hypothetical protein